MTQRTASSPRQRFLFALTALAALVGVGVIGYLILEPDWSILDALFMTVITLTTVGFQEVHPLDDAGRLFTVFLIVGGVGTVTYTAFTGAGVLLESGLHRALGRRTMDRQVARLKDHIVVCGFGRVGRAVCEEFVKRDAPFVVIERDPERANVPPSYLLVAGDATEDETLLAAGTDRASSMVAALSESADNVYVCLSARQFNRTLRITARADSDSTERKLRRAGANRVVCPYRAGARRMAVTTLNPNVVEFVNLVTGDASSDLQLEEVEVRSGSQLVGQSLKTSRIRDRFDAVVVGIKHAQAKSLINPPAEETIRAGDVLFLIGPGQDCRSWPRGPPAHPRRPRRVRYEAGPHRPDHGPLRAGRPRIRTRGIPGPGERRPHLAAARGAGPAGRAAWSTAGPAPVLPRGGTGSRRGPAQVEEQRTQLAADVDVRVEIVAGEDVAQTVTRFAIDNQADLIALSSHGRSGLRRLVLGSVAEAVIRHAHTPVLCIPPNA